MRCYSGVTKINEDTQEICEQMYLKEIEFSFSSSAVHIWEEQTRKSSFCTRQYFGTSFNCGFDSPNVIHKTCFRVVFFSPTDLRVAEAIKTDATDFLKPRASRKRIERGSSSITATTTRKSCDQGHRAREQKWKLYFVQKITSLNGKILHSANFLFVIAPRDVFLCNFLSQRMKI